MQVHAELPNAPQEGYSDRACVAHPGANIPAASAGRTVCLAAAAGGLALGRAASVSSKGYSA